jgi:hypothetical protein
MKWIQGKKLLEPPYSKSHQEIFQLVENGALVPYEKAPPTFYATHEHNGARRIFPTWQHEKQYDSLIGLRSQLSKCEEWLSRPDSENHSLVEDPQVKRDRLTREVEQKSTEINLLNSELDPGRVWKNLDLSPARQEELLSRLLEGQYLKSEVEKLLGSGLIQPHTPTKRKNHIDHEIARQRTADYLEQDPGLSLTEMVQKLQCNHRNNSKQLFTRDYSDRTITEWIRNLFTSYTPSKPGKKKKKPATE